MVLFNKYKNTKYAEMGEYHCDISEYLDKQAGIESNSRWKHYVLADTYCLKEQCLAIRIPGGTVGGIWIDDNAVITKIVVDTDYVVKTYPENINELLQEFIGEVIEIRL